MNTKGYGKILDIDLASGNIAKKEIDPEFTRRYMGGMMFAHKILYEEAGPGVDPLGPDNIIIFAPGAFTGSYIPQSGRMEITTRNPYDGSLGTGNTGGFSGIALKHAGWDLLILRNKAEKPVYLYIDNDSVQIKDARHLWGKDANVTTEMLESELPYKLPIIALGQAGENLVPYACPTTEYHHGANRAGVGAVMGSKKIKALAFRGTSPPQAARPDKLVEALIALHARRELSRKAMHQPGSYTGGGGTLARYLEFGGLRAKNYQSNYMPDLVERLGPETARKYIAGRETTCRFRKSGFIPQVMEVKDGQARLLTGKDAEVRCNICPSPCFNYTNLKEGKYAGTVTGRPEFVGIACAWGTNVAIDNLPAIWKCKEMCQRYGIDYVAASGAIAFAMELYQRGILTKKDTDGMELTWGNEASTIELLRKIAYREGFGEVLAHGVQGAADAYRQRFGKIRHNHQKPGADGR